MRIASTLWLVSMINNADNFSLNENAWAGTRWKLTKFVTAKKRRLLPYNDSLQIEERKKKTVFDWNEFLSMQWRWQNKQNQMNFATFGKFPCRRMMATNKNYTNAEWRIITMNCKCYYYCTFGIWNEFECSMLTAPGWSRAMHDSMNKRNALATIYWKEFLTKKKSYNFSAETQRIVAAFKSLPLYLNAGDWVNAKRILIEANTVRWTFLCAANRIGEQRTPNHR